MNKTNIRYIGLPRYGGGLKNIKKYKELSDDDSDYSSYYSSDESNESETEIANRQLEARFWKTEEGKEAYNFFLSTLNNKQETIVRSNEENKDIMNLIKSFIK